MSGTHLLVYSWYKVTVHLYLYFGIVKYPLFTTTLAAAVRNRNISLEMERSLNDIVIVSAWQMEVKNGHYWTEESRKSE